MTNHFKIKINFYFTNFYLLQIQCFYVDLFALHFATSMDYLLHNTLLKNLYINSHRVLSLSLPLSDFASQINSVKMPKQEL